MKEWQDVYEEASLAVEHCTDKSQLQVRGWHDMTIQGSSGARGRARV
jgi:hypothetical protein